MTWIDITVFIGGVIVIAGCCAKYFHNYFILKKQYDEIEKYKQQAMYQKQLQMVKQFNQQKQSSSSYKSKEEPERNKDIYQ